MTKKKFPDAMMSDLFHDQVTKFKIINKDVLKNKNPRKVLGEQKYMLAGILRVVIGSYSMYNNDNADCQTEKDNAVMFEEFTKVLLNKLVGEDVFKSFDRNEEIGNFVQGLILFGATKEQAFIVTAEWLGLAKSTIRTLHTRHSRFGNFISEDFFHPHLLAFIAGPRIYSCAASVSAPFPIDRGKTSGAYKRMMKSILESRSVINKRPMPPDFLALYSDFCEKQKKIRQ